MVDYNATRADLSANYVDGLNYGTITLSLFTGNTGVSGNETIKADNPVIGSYCSGCSNIVVNSVTYYDEYGAPGTKAFNTNFAFASNMPSNVELTTSSSQTLRTNGMVTQTKTRVLDANHDDNIATNDIFLVSNVYYDEKGRRIQELADNYNGLGKSDDIVTTQYDFAGRQLAQCQRHTASGTVYTNFFVYAKYELDKRGGLKKLYKKYSNGAAGSLTDADFKQIASYEMGMFGQLKKKVLAPGYNNITTGQSEMESFNYDYNIQGKMTGINRSFVATNVNTDQWTHYFGLFLGYDNRDAQLQFNNARLDGSLTGMIWKTQGDNTPRKYNFSYDNAGRFTQADFQQRLMPTDLSWSNALVDFTVNNIQYDENGNLKQMNQRGIKPGQNSGFYIDKLTYGYANTDWSNRLTKVTDLGDLGTENGKLEDFNGANPGSVDYYYDLNGNLTKDLNKSIVTSSGEGVVYNFLNKPQQLTIQNTRQIDYIYDASGERLCKKVTDLSGGGQPVKYTWYIGDFVYEQIGSAAPDLQMINHEEGRIKSITSQNITSQIPALTVTGNFPLPGTNRQGVYEYFVRDHLGSVRMVLSEESHMEQHKCTMETAAQTYEYANFGQNEVSGAYLDGTGGTPWPGRSSKIMRLQSTGAKIGPNFMLKVMAGDGVSPEVLYYAPGMTSPDYTNIISDIANSIIGAIISSGPRAQGYSKEFYSSINTNLNSGAGLLQTHLNNVPANAGVQRAYLNILYFDEFFNLIPYDAASGTGSRSFPVDLGTGTLQPNTVAPKHGYAFIYVSNHSSQPVYFDDLSITHERARISEEKHYYPFGATISYLHAKAYSKLVNKYGFQGGFAEEDEETKWNEFDLRTYDPQIGRFINIDPEDEFHSGYAGMGNRPVNNVDPTGGSVFGSVGFWMATGGAIIGGVLGSQSAREQGIDHRVGGMLGAMAGAALGWGLSQVPWSQLTMPRVNVFIVYSGASAALNNVLNGDALDADYLFAKVKEAFSFGKMIVIKAANIDDAATQLRDKLGGRKIKNLVIDSHGHTGNASFDIDADKVSASTITTFETKLRKLGEFTDSKTRVALGACWAGAPRYNGPEMLGKLSEYLNGASVYGHASVNDSRSLFANGNFTSYKSASVGTYAQNEYTQINTGTWYKAANGGVGTELNGYVRIGNAGKVIEVPKQYLKGARLRHIQRLDYIRDHVPSGITPIRAAPAISTTTPPAVRVPF